MTYRNLKDIYQNDENNLSIGKELMASCLYECIHYRRGTAYFSSSSLKTYASFLGDIIKNDVKIEILCSPVIQDQKLREILGNNSTKEKMHAEYLRVSEDILLSAAGFSDNPNNIEYRSKILSYLIAKGQLEIKFAIPNGYEEAVKNETDYESLYHVKNGYFDFPNGDRVVFDGSFNESLSGHLTNRERTNVFRSWHPEDKGRLERTANDINNDWDEKSSDLDIYPLGEEILLKIKKLAPKSKPLPDIENPIAVEDNVWGLWNHQKKAIDTFIKKKRGILEMATGTGKTTTSLEIVKRLYESNKIDSVIISTFGTTLLGQWVKEVQEWKKQYPKDKSNRSIGNLYVFKDFDGSSEMPNYLNIIKDSVLIVSRNPRKLNRLLVNRRIDSHKQKILIIHDEVHGYGSKELVSSLQGSHENIRYRLGLSATPDREYDEHGTNFITNEIGQVIYQYSIEDAIKDGILCEFKYHTIDFEYTKKDKENIKKIYSKKASSEKKGEPWSKERLYMELSNIRKKAESKPFLLNDFLSNNKDLINSSIFFVADKLQGKKIARIIGEYTEKYTTFYEGAPDKFIELLDKNEIDAVVACERLNEGVDIKSLRNIFLISTPRAKLVTIQRMGRCLRVDPKNKSKISNIVDFILVDNETDSEYVPADQYRKQWIEDLSLIRRSDA